MEYTKTEKRISARIELSPYSNKILAILALTGRRLL